MYIPEQPVSMYVDSVKNLGLQQLKFGCDILQKVQLSDDAQLFFNALFEGYLNGILSNGRLEYEREWSTVSSGIRSIS